jgi:ABC-type Fe3+/spermidine/putrescine transport system ATPase subunit
VADFVGSANLLEVAQLSEGLVRIAGQELVADTRAATASGSKRLVLRSENLALLPRQAPPPANALAVTLTGRQYLGAKTLCRVALDTGEVLQVDVPGLELHQPGDRLWLQVPPSSRVISQ